MPDDEIAVGIEIGHQRQKVLQRLGFILFISFGVDSKGVFALNGGQAFDLDARHGPDMHGDRKNSARGSGQ